jgi:chromosomal replication initiator protein
LAGELVDNVRQLESGLIGITAKASLLGNKIDLNLAQSVVETIVRERREITLDTIKKTVSKHFQISVKDLVSRSRKQKILRPRQIAMYLSRHYTDQPLQAIGKSFNRYHATALHAIGVIEVGIKNNSAIKQQVQYLSRRLENGKS